MFLHKQRLSVLLFLYSVSVLGLWVVITSFVGLHAVAVEYNLLVVSSSECTASLIFDNVSMSFSWLVTFVSGSVFMFARWYMKEDYYYQRFMWILLSFVVSMNILIFSGSLFILLLGWDGLGVSSFALIIYYQNKDSLSAGFLTLMINRVGDVLLMGSTCLFVVCGSMSLLCVPLSDISMFLLLIFALAGMTKSAQYPYSAWLPAAMAAPTPVSALVHSSTLVTAGIYIIIRVMMSVEVNSTVSSMLLFCGSVTSLIGGICAIYENDIKKVVAFSTLSQLGVMVFSLGLGSYMLSLMHLYTHAMFKAMLFLAAGCILLLSYGVQDLRLLGSITKNSPAILVFLNMSTLCLMGFPFLSGFYSKHSILNLMWGNTLNLLSVVLMIVATTLTSVYMVRLLKMLNWTRQSVPLSFTSLSLPATAYLSMCFLYMGSLFLGWSFSTLDSVFVNYFYLPFFCDWVMNLSLVIGVMVGVFMYKVGGSGLISSMFYMDTTSKLINKVNYYISVQCQTFERGWVEPYMVLSSGSAMVKWVNKKQWWPSGSLRVFSPIALMLGIFYISWYY